MVNSLSENGRGFVDCLISLMKFYPQVNANVANQFDNYDENKFLEQF